MKARRLFDLALLLASTAPLAATTCPTVDVRMLDRGFAEAAPWRIVSGGPAECSFMAKTSSVNFGFSLMGTASIDAATSAAIEMQKAVAGTSVVEPIPSLGEHGFAYQPKKADGTIDPASMFFFGHRGSVDVSGYLNLKGAITPAQRVLAANLIAGTLGIATKPKALAKATNCRYLDPALVERLLPAGDVSAIVPDANNCIVSAGGTVITVAVTRDARGWDAAERLLKNGGCTVERIPDLGKAAGIAHRCSTGNPRAEVVVLAGGRKIALLFAPEKEPAAQERATLIELARFAAGR